MPVPLFPLSSFLPMVLSPGPALLDPAADSAVLCAIYSYQKSHLTRRDSNLTALPISVRAAPPKRPTRPALLLSGTGGQRLRR